MLKLKFESNMKKNFKNLMKILLVLSAITLTGCVSSNSSAVPVETWKPAVVNETSLQAWRLEVKAYSNELTSILNRSSEK